MCACVGACMCANGWPSAHAYVCCLYLLAGCWHCGVHFSQRPRGRGSGCAEGPHARGTAAWMWGDCCACPASHARWWCVARVAQRVGGWSRRKTRTVCGACILDAAVTGVGIWACGSWAGGLCLWGRVECCASGEGAWACCVCRWMARLHVRAPSGWLCGTRSTQGLP